MVALAEEDYEERIRKLETELKKARREAFEQATQARDQVSHEGPGCLDEYQSIIRKLAEDPIAPLRDAIAHVEKTASLPRCKHGSALQDHAFEVLTPPCGCKLTDTHANRQDRRP